MQEHTIVHQSQEQKLMKLISNMSQQVKSEPCCDEDETKLLVDPKDQQHKLQKNT